MTQLFWRNFFALLLIFVAIAQWACVAWLAASLFGLRVPTWAHVVAPFFIYVLNRWIVRRPVSPGSIGLRLRRGYTAFAFTSLFGFLVLILVAVLYAGARGALALVTSLVPMEAAGPTLDQFARALATGGVLAAAAAIAYGYTFGQRRVWINEIDVPIAELDPRLDGFSIVQISDIHLGPYMDEHDIARYVARIDQLAPDLVVITGDITDGLDHAPRTFPSLGRLRARCGVYAILGNHDFYAGADQVTEALARYTPFTVLRDEFVVLEVDGAKLCIIGLDDRGMDWARGLRHCDTLERLAARAPHRVPKILLTHRPDLFPQASRLRIDLVLCGHTHGGQLAVPLPGRRPATLAHFMTRYPRGTYRRGRTTLHVNLGLGVTGQPVRVATPREITVLRLRA